MLTMGRSPLTFLLATASIAISTTGIAQTETGNQGFCMHGPGVNLPLGKFLVIRKGDQIGALRLTKITNDTTTKPKAREWIGNIDYESYFSKGLGSPLATAAVHRGTMHFGRIRGFGFHYSWQSGNTEAIVGPWKFAFFDQDGMFMTTVDFWHGINNDSGLEFAPTAATRIAQIDPKATDLQWFGYDVNRDIPCPMRLPAPAHP